MQLQPTHHKIIIISFMSFLSGFAYVNIKNSGRKKTPLVLAPHFIASEVLIFVVLVFLYRICIALKWFSESCPTLN